MELKNLFNHNSNLSVSGAVTIKFNEVHLKSIKSNSEFCSQRGKIQ